MNVRFIDGYLGNKAGAGRPFHRASRARFIKRPLDVYFSIFRFPLSMQVHNYIKI